MTCVPLFGPPPGGPGMTLVFLALVVGLLITAGAAVLVYADASRRGNDDAEWWGLAVAVGGFLLSVPGVVLVGGLYLLVR